MKIKVIVPVIGEGFLEPTKNEAEKYSSEKTTIDVENLAYGTASIEDYYDEMLVAPDILRIVKEAESDGFDGVFIDCFGDPALDAARELVEIPIVGPGSISMHIASELAHRFSVITVLEDILPLIEDMAYKTGVGKKLASVRSVDIPVLGLEDEEKLMKNLIKESKKSIEKDGAHAIVLGCTGMMGITEKIEKELNNMGYQVPVIYPVAVAIQYLEFLNSIDISHSKRTYRTPPEKERNVYESLK